MKCYNTLNMDNLKPHQVAEFHRSNAATITAIIAHNGIISIRAGEHNLNLLPGSEHYEQLKHKLSDFGCDHVAKKLQTGENICTQPYQTKAR